MQRMPAGSYRQIDDDWVIDFPPELQSRPTSSSPRRRVDANAALADPSHHPVQIFGGRRDVRRSRSWYWIKENWVHAIPLVVLLNLFILWWFSYPVGIPIKQGGFAEALRMVIQPSKTSDQKVELAVLASSSPLTPISGTPSIVSSISQTEPPSTTGTRIGRSG